MNSALRHSLALTLGCALVGLAAPAFAHITVASPVYAGARGQLLTFSVGHGCTGADTIGVLVHLPEAITTVRAVPGPFGEATVATSSAGIPLSVEWTKAAARPADDQFYQFQIRINVPDTPFQTLYFHATQTCRAATGEVTTVEWEALPGEEGEPAAALQILPPRFPGWNKVMVAAQMDDLTVFDDAQIVWAGSSAYSSNPATKELIEAETDVETLTSIPAATEIWVKY